jgi:hydrophobic/amphiphilic exporter-1 (mainly G- bacteria), HAE1 family
MPIALGHGAGAELRQPLGIAVVGGLLVSQLLTLYITPVIYIYLDKIDALIKGRAYDEITGDVITDGPIQGQAVPIPAAVHKPDI